MNGGGETSRIQTSTTSTTPWAQQQNYLLPGFEGAATLKNQGLLAQGAAPFSSVVPLSNQTEASLQGTEAAAGNPIFGAATGELGKTIAGDYAGAGNPFLSGMIQNVGREIAPQLEARFANSGSAGGSLHATALADALAKAGTNLGFQNYENERGRMLATASNPQLLAQSVTAPSQLLGQVGAAREQQAGAQMQEQLANWQANSSQPARNLAAYMGLIGGNYGQTTTQQQPIYSNNLATYGGLGLGLAGLGLNAARLFG